MPSSFVVFIVGALLAAAAGFWLLRAWRRADPSGRAAPALIVVTLVAAIALGAYIAIGHPTLPDGAYAGRMAALRRRPPESYTADEMLAVLGEMARADRGNPQPLVFTGQLQLDRGDAQAAARSFSAALRREPASVDAKLGLARAMVGIEEGRVSPQALALFQEVAAVSDDPAPWIYQAMAAMQANKSGEARRLWGEAYQRMAANDPRRDMARQMHSGRPPRQSGR